MQNVLDVIQKNIRKQNVYFVFPTDISSTTWSEYILFKGITEAVATERFIAWDSFKSECIRSQHQDKKSIPSLLRKFFSLNIIEKNKKENIFHSIINPEFMHTSTSFADWIAGVLPQLSSWSEKTHINDDEDRDLLLLKNEYEQFLELNNLFDPAWEKPPFHTGGNTYFIMYPEIIQDFTEYKDILTQAECIELVYMDAINEDIEVLQYTNSRSELKETCLFIRECCTPIDQGGKGLQWSDIALNVKDVDTYEPYIRQEFSLYNIPIRMRSGKVLGMYPAGRLFSLIKDCYSENFSFKAVKNLVLDPVFPWSNATVAEQLIYFGKKNNCLMSYDNKDVWLDAFKSSFGEKLANDFYVTLKKLVTNIAKSTNFTYLMEHYVTFREEFFNIDLATDETNLIMSRCISELSTLIDLEKSYPNAVMCEDPLSVFIEQLNSKEYVIQSKDNGVNIFTYKLAATAPFKQHIILDSSQSALTVTNNAFAFLRENKRKALNIVDQNTSNYFIHHYALHSDQTVHFSFSQNSFSGFEIPYNALSPKKIYTQIEAKDVVLKEDEFVSKKIDLYKDEKLLFLGQKNTLDSIYSVQYEGFFNWLNSSELLTNTCLDGYTECLRDTINKKIVVDGKVIVSATSLKQFYECPVKWLIERVLKIEDFSLETNLLDDVYIGTFYHEVLKLVLTKYKSEKRLLCVDENGALANEIVDFITCKTKEIAAHFPHSCNIRDLNDLTIEIFKSKEDVYIQRLIEFFTEFSINFSGSSVIDIEKDVEIEYDTYKIVGKIDCILDVPDTVIEKSNKKQEQTILEGGKFIIDFKTGKTPSRLNCIKQKNQELKDFQLSLYTHLYEHVAFKGKPTVSGCAFTSIHKKNIVPILGVIKPEGKKENPNTKKDKLSRLGYNEEGYSFEPTLKETLNAVDWFVNAILDEKLELFLNPKKWGYLPNGNAVTFETCSACNFRKFCRTTYTISGATR